MESRGKMVVEMDITDMGAISIALDHYTFSATRGRFAEQDLKAWQELRDRWDTLYRSTHSVLDLGVRSIEHR